ncbi:MAG: hypothetical protein HY716_03260 [Planctomycetes bacterium]|nr:hypothetical protein [Planctomycetota bacterium]
MNKLTLALLVGLIGLLAAIQFWGLEPSPEQALERQSMNFGELRATALLPTYVGSLFLGSFRAVAVDVLWIQLYRMRQQEHRYFETVEIMELISRLQPRNPEVHVYLSHDMAYNIANQFLPDRERTELALLEAEENRPEITAERAAQIRILEAELRERIDEKLAHFKRWIKAGLEKLLDGIHHLKDDPYLKSQVAWTLWHKGSYRDGVFEEDFLRIIETDPEIQVRLLGGKAAETPLSAFELAEHWYGLTLDDLRQLQQQQRFTYYAGFVDRLQRGSTEERDYATTQMGLNLHPMNIDGMRRHARFLHACYTWHRAELEEARGRGAEAASLFAAARDSFERSAARGDAVRATYPDSPRIFQEYSQLDRRLAVLMEERRTAPRPIPPEDRARYLTRLIGLRHDLISKGYPNLDYGFVLARAGAVKIELGGDPWEYNDDIHAATPLWPGRPVRATLGPDRTDADAYQPQVPRPHAHDASEPAPPISLGFRIRRTGAVDLAVTLYALSLQGTDLKPVDRFDVRGPELQEKWINVEPPGPYFLVVRAAEPGPSPSENGSYILQFGGVKQ